MSQQELHSEQIHRDGPQAPYAGYEGTPQYNNYSAGFYGQKLSSSVTGIRQAPGPLSRMVLAVISLILFMVVIFGLIFTAIGMHATDWAIIPIMMIIILFGIVVAIINVAFNHSH